ncbi:MAG: HAD-IA family hydrolase [Rhodospirillaceae bacterium]|nr:HAD-IA family hydrolase [Rhodospirillaceae bacterium]
MKTALLFDLDGTLVDTDHLHLDAFNQLFAEHGFQVDRPTYTARIMGKPNSGIAEAFLPHMPRAEALALLTRKEAAYRDMVGEQLTPIAGLIHLLDWADGHRIPCGVVTNAPRANAELVLAALGISQRFQTLVIGDELAHAKPHPLPYLTGLERLGASAAHSVAFEDSPSGLRAAVDARIPAVGLMTALAAAQILEIGATLAVADFRDDRVRDLILQRMADAA